VSEVTVIEKFERDYQSYHGIDPSRRREQVKAIEAMAAEAEMPPEECGAEEVKKYLATLSDRGLHVNSIRKHLNMLKPFFNWAWEAGIIDAERLLVVQRIAAPRTSNSHGTPKPYSKKDLERFRAELDRAWPTVEEKFWARWKRGTSPYRRIQPHAMRIQIEAIVALALHCGLRRAEIFKASMDDIHYDNAFIVVRHAKGDQNGDKLREVPHTKTSREAVRAWFELRAILDPDHDKPWLSLAWEGVALRPMRWTRFKGILCTIKQHLAPPGTKITDHWRLHRFRHTAGTEWLRTTRRLEIVQKLLGHATLQQTLGYAKLVRDDLHEAVAKSELEFEEAVGAR
jgi:site-specific recombinase XerD